MRKRPLIILSIAFLSGVLFAAFKVDIIFAAMAAALLLVYTFLYKKAYFPLLLAAVIFCVCGFVRFQWADLARSKALQKFSGKSMSCTFIVSEFSENGRAVAEFTENSKKHKVYLNIKNAPSLAVGDTVKAKAEFCEPPSSKVSISDFSTYLASRKVYFYAYADSVKVLGTYKKGTEGFIYSVRRYINNLGEKSFNDDDRALFNAMVLGDKSHISDELSQKIQKAGLSHVAVVSGMHLSVVLALVMMLSKKIFGRLRIRNALSMAAVIFITLITGAGASVVRACIMCSVYLSARFFYRDSDSLNTLFLTVLVMAVFNPYIIFNAGFVLSVASVMGILVFYNKLSDKTVKFAGKTAGEALAVSISAQLVVTPISVYYFSALTPYSLLSNLFVSIFASGIVIFSILFAVVGKIPFIGAVTGFFVRFFSQAIVFICDFVEGLPSSSVEIKEIGLVFIVLWIFVLLYAAAKKNSFIRSKKAAAICALICAAVIFAEGYMKNFMRFNFVPYGKASMTAVSICDENVFLIDCPDCYEAENISAEFKTGILSGNYEAQMLHLMENGAVNEIVAYGPQFSQNKKKELFEKVKAEAGRITFLDENENYSFPGGYISFISFEQTGIESVAVQIEYNGRSFVSLKGFSNKEIRLLKEKGAYIDCDVLKLPFYAMSHLEKAKELTDGKVLCTEKEFAINLN